MVHRFPLKDFFSITGSPIFCIITNKTEQKKALKMIASPILIRSPASHLNRPTPVKRIDPVFRQICKPIAAFTEPYFS